MSGHTPGPWRCGVVSGAIVIWADDGPPRTQVARINNRGYPETANPNARLIAAAPDLLSIAKRWAAIDGGSWHVERHASEKAELEADTRAVIARATGEQL